MADVNISLTVARWLVDFGRRLVEEAFARPWDPRNPNIRWDIPPELGPNHGFLDQIETNDPRVAEWLQQTIQFIRTLSAIISHAIDEDAENISPLTSLFGDEEEI